MPPQIALLRGINLGSRNRVPMPELRERLGEAGYGEVRTVVQSGNLVLEKPADADELRKLIKGWFDVDQPVIVRTAAQWRRVIEKNPLDIPDGKRFQVVFFAGRIKEIDVGDIGDEEVAFAGREIYCSHPNGIQRSPLVRALAKLEGGTARNWNTILKLEELI